MALLFLLGITAAFVLGFVCGVVVTAIAAANRGIKGMERSR